MSDEAEVIRRPAGRAAARGLAERGPEHDEEAVIRRHAGAELSGATEDGRPPLLIPGDQEGLRALHQAHLERTHVAIRPGATPLSYEAWLRSIPYTLAQRAIRRALRAVVRAGAPELSPATILMSDARKRLLRPHVFGIDVLLRWPALPDIGHGRDHNIEVNRASMVVCLHARAAEPGFTYDAVRFICSPPVRDALNGAMRAAWEAGARQPIEASLSAADWPAVAAAAHRWLAELIRAAYLPKLGAP